MQKGLKIMLILLFLIVCSVSSGWAAALYIYTDDEGTRYITDSMEKVPPKYRDSVKVYGEPDTRKPVTIGKKEMGIYMYLPSDEAEMEWFLLITKRISVPEIGIKEEMCLKEVAKRGFFLNSSVDIGNRKDNASYVYDTPDERDRVFIGKKEMGIFMYDHDKSKWMILITQKFPMSESAIKWEMPAKDCRVIVDPNIDFGNR